HKRPEQRPLPLDQRHEPPKLPSSPPTSRKVGRTSLRTLRARPRAPAAASTVELGERLVVIVDVHFQAPHFTEFFAALGDMLPGPPGARCMRSHRRSRSTTR